MMRSCAPMRVKMRSTGSRRAASAGTLHPSCAMTPEHVSAQCAVLPAASSKSGNQSNHTVVAESALTLLYVQLSRMGTGEHCNQIK